MLNTSLRMNHILLYEVFFNRPDVSYWQKLIFDLNQSVVFLQTTILIEKPSLKKLNNK